MTTGIAEGPVAFTDGPPGQQVRILVVDDRPENLLALGTLLEGPGRTLVLAGSGREALRELLRDQFALILLDVNMPGMDGFETAQLIRRRPSCAHTPIIFITAQHDEGLATRSYELGAVDYISTPVNGEILRAKAAVFVELFRKTEENRWQAELLRLAEQRLRRQAEEKLWRADEQFRLVVESVSDYAIFSLDATGVIATWNAGAERLFGFTENEAVGRDAVMLVPEDQRDDGRLLQRAHAEGRAELDLWFEPKSGARFFGRGVVTAMRDPEGRVIGYSTIVHDATARKQAEEAQARHAEELQTANRLKDEFLAVLSHELRTPLNAIIGWTHILRKGRLDPERTRQGLEAIARNGAAQLGLISDILDVSRFIAGKLRLTLAPVDLRDAARAAVDTATHTVQAKGVTLAVELGSEPLMVKADAERLQQIVWNLVSNAVKFTPAGGHVSVAARRREDKVVVSVADDGIGIEPSFLPHVFERFRQADSSSARRHGGLGLGLAIVRHLVELHGGAVRAESEGEGRGTTFEVELPAFVDTPAALEPAATMRAEPAAVGLVRSIPGVRCLVVDDDPDGREMLKTVLEREGFVVTVADSSAAALEHVGSVQLLIADIGMPGEDGHTLIRRVRALTPGCGGRLPSIALTAYASERDREQALDAGFNRHMTKPVQHQELLRTIAELLEEAASVPPTEQT